MLRYLLLAAFLGLVAILGIGLGLNPREVPSPFIGKAVPEFSLPRLRYPDQLLSNSQLKGKISMVNFWATWCVACRDEHPLLVHIADSTGIPIYGINYKDQRESAQRWLNELGDPYVSSGYDDTGALGLDFGVYGLPETFIIAADGTVAYKHIGPISPSDWQEKLLPVIRALGG